MSKTEKPILHIHETVKEDTLNYRSGVKKFLDGQTSPIAFRAYRVPMGVYEHRTEGQFMVRIRIGAGLVLPFQLQRIAELSKKYGNGILHVTTRQDIQIHEVSIEDTPDVLEGLLEVGLSSRGGGGNTVRNVSACPEAGVCPKEEFDIAPYAIATAEYLLQDRSSFNLPRKYKIVFSGCSQDCAFASVADLGFFAHIKDGVKGFAAYAGGGLGPNPRVGVKIEDFIDGNEIFEVAEAIKRLFDKYGDRANKHKARLRYVLARFGAEEFTRLYNQERASLKTSGDILPIPEIRDIASANPAAESAVTVRLKLKNGDIPADDLKKVGEIATKYGQGFVRTTQLQSLFITSVLTEDVDKVNNELKALSIDCLDDGRPKIVACTGAATCKLGLCLSRGLADAISSELSRAELPDTTIKISGCPNSCGHHYIADIGLQGKAKRVDGKLLPCYEVFVGANIVEGDAHLAERIGTVPAKRVPALLAEALSSSTVEKEKLKTLISKYSDITQQPLPDDYYYDFGATEPFSLAGRGPGECGAGVTDVIKVDIDQAKDAIKPASADSENIYRAIIASARSLLVTFGLEPKKDRQILTAFSEHLIKPGWVKPQTQKLLDSALDWKVGDIESIEDLRGEVKDLIDRIEVLFLSLDANLNFKAEPVARKTQAEDNETKDHSIDLRGVACPLNYVKAKLELEKLEINDILDVLVDAGEPVRNVPASFVEQGQDVLEVKSVNDYFCVKVCRKK